MPVAALRSASSAVGSLGALQSLLAERFPSAIAPLDRQPTMATGVTGLDAILPHGGLPRGRVTVWETSLGGSSAMLHAIAVHQIARGERVAWIDGGRTIGPQWRKGPLVIRPVDPTIAKKAADILLKCGGFGLVILTGTELDSAAMLRFSRMAHEGGGAFVAVTSATHTAMLRLESRYLADRFRTAPTPFGEPALVERVALRVDARAPGWNAHAIFHLSARPHDLRLSLEPGVADRRGDLG